MQLYDVADQDAQEMAVARLVDDGHSEYCAWGMVGGYDCGCPGDNRTTTEIAFDQWVSDVCVVVRRNRRAVNRLAKARTRVGRIMAAWTYHE